MYNAYVVDVRSHDSSEVHTKLASITVLGSVLSLINTKKKKFYLRSTLKIASTYKAVSLLRSFTSRACAAFHLEFILKHDCSARARFNALYT